MKPYLCKFCNKHLHNSDYDNYIVPKVANYIFRCLDCKACFHYCGQTKKTYYWYFAVGEYIAVFDLINKYFEIWDNDSQIKPVLKLDQVPDTITPSNAAEKLKTYILFS